MSEDVFEDNRVVLLFVVGGKEQRHSSRFGHFFQQG
jgi:hypothetical protein